MRCSTNRLERSPYDFEWKYNTSVIIPLRDKFRLRHVMRKRVYVIACCAKTKNFMVCFG